MLAIYGWIALGSALGGTARYWMALAVTRLTGGEFPWGTILINIIGSLVIGIFAALAQAGGRWQLPAEAQAFVMVGLCGGFTTFSSFSLQTLVLLRDGRPGQALANVLISVLLCVAATTLGYWLAARAAQP